MRCSAPVLCLLSSLAASIAAQGYTTDFESFTASAGGTPCAGQDGFYVPAVAGSIDGALYTYAGNTLGVPLNANGGANFYAGLSISPNFARSQRVVTVPTGRIHIEFDVLCNYAGAVTPTNNIGSFSFQPSGTSVYVNLLARWPTGVLFPPTTWNADYVLGPTAAGTQSVLADPAFQNLAVGVWHRWGVTVNLTTGEHINFSIRNGTTGITTVFTPPASLPLPGAGTAMPTDFRLFTGGADNVFAVDNFTITYGADYTTFGAGCAGALGVPTLAASPGSLPVLGQTLSVDVGNLPVGVGLMITGLSNTLFAGAVPLPLPLAGFGFPGCDLLVDPILSDLIAGAGTTATWSFVIPMAPTLAGFEIFNQGASLDPGPIFLKFSNGGRAVLGL
ncbi:MAG TPA: hypothetical protein VFZ65_08560 [Planctomycetota bacterium]|nr:hypothetical protein [Planctomycetota bacterium]